MNITESRLPQDGAIKATLEDINLDLRVSSMHTNKGEKIVIRILDYSLSLAGLESLGLSQENLKKVLTLWVFDGILSKRSRERPTDSSQTKKFLRNFQKRY